MSRRVVSSTSFRASDNASAIPLLQPLGAQAPIFTAHPGPAHSYRDPAATRLQEACDQIESQVAALEVRVARSTDGRALRPDVTQLSDSLRRLRNMLAPFQVRFHTVLNSSVPFSTLIWRNRNRVYSTVQWCIVFLFSCRNRTRR